MPVQGGDSLARVPVLAAGAREAAYLDGDETVEVLPLPQAAAKARAGPAPLVCHLPALVRRLDCAPFLALDALELFAFVRPAQFCVPTARGLAAIAGLEEPHTLEEQARALRECALTLLSELGRKDYPDPAEAAAVARRMADHGWSWGAAVGRALDLPEAQGRLDVWRRLPEWSDRAPPAPSGQAAVAPGEARARLAALLGAGAEPRPQQADYASAVSRVFGPRDNAGAPRVVLAEAGTGVGKTLGYVAPASVWVDKNEGTVWISTYSKNLQRQIDRELDRLYPDAAEKRRKVAVRKGRENYLCLLNFEDAARRPGESALAGMAGASVGLGLIARWVAHTRDGDMGGGDFPGWLADLAGRRRTAVLTDRRGECVHSACPHWRRCFIERAARRARHADLVIANHALVLALAAGDRDLPHQPRHLVFDEGHHLFDSADSAFSVSLSGLDTRELRRWLRGVESPRRGRARGLSRRTGDLVEDDPAAAEALRAVLAAARLLPEEGWLEQLAAGQPRGPCEAFLAAVRRQVKARARDPGPGFGLEAEARPPLEGLLTAAAALDAALESLAAPMAALEAAFGKRLEDEAGALDSQMRIRLDATARALRRRRAELVVPWRAMLKSLASEPDKAFIDWFTVARRDGRESDVGMRRHRVDPTEPFVEAVLRPAAGALITSATLRDATGDVEADWQTAERRTGAAHLAAPSVRAAVPSPFDYGAQTRAFVVTDVDRDDPGQVAGACRALFCASGGGALGLFTAIWRLRRVYERLSEPLDAAGLLLLAQHVDGGDTGTLVDIFRAERHACMLGTDALRDGVDVPGDSLRLIVFDRVPWPRPDILHKARRKHFGGRAWDDMTARLRLRQAFGRLVRRTSDAGVFVMLDAATPTRLLGAFPEGVPVHRAGLAEVAAETRAFLAASRDAGELTARFGSL